MKKETFTEKAIKKFYGVTGPLDEQKRQEVNRLGNNAFMFLFTVILFGNLIPYFFAEKYPTIVAYAYPAALEILILSVALVIVVKSKNISEIDLDTLNEEEKKSVARNTKFLGLNSGVSFAILFHILSSLVMSVNQDSSFLSYLVHPRRIITSLVAGFFFGFFIQFYTKRRIRKDQKEE
ncbi:MAG: DUF3278 domain-containing protein [Streptococcus sp.]|nr:DUF3278 domain-containing protein [Streptococcus sp.]